MDYIEENLRSELDLDDAARAAGYSKYHFARVFREACGLTPADYIRKRRITEIVRRINAENRPICDIAFEFGFNSKENFIRAFKNEHHILPTEYKSAENSLKLCGRPELNPERFCADGKIVSLGAFRLAAYRSDEQYAPNFWNKYNAKKLSQKLSGGRIAEDFGACRWNPVSARLEYWIGIKASDAAGDTSGTVFLDIPGGDYAVFDTPAASHFNFVNTIHKTWDYIGRVWLPEHGCERTGSYELERYVESSRTYTERIYIPIREKRSTHEKAEREL